MLDAELLAEVYVELIGARQANLGLAEAVSGGGETRVTAIVIRARPEPLAPRIAAEELEAHRAFIAAMGEAAIWRKYGDSSNLRPLKETENVFKRDDACSAA